MNKGGPGGRKGQVAVLVALQLTFIFAMVGFLVDLGLVQFKRHAMQAAADSAAMAAAGYAADNGASCGSGVTCGGTATNCTYGTVNAFVAGCLYAENNGYKQGTAHQTVTMYANNTGGPVAGSNLFFRATVGDSQPTLFGIFSGFSSLSLNAAATAQTSTVANGSCIIALSTSGTAISDSGSGNITTSNCGIYDNSSLSYSGSGNISTTGGATDYYGSYSATGSGNVNPAPTHVASYAANPFGSLPVPTVGGCTTTGESISDSSNHTLPASGASGTYVYCGGLHLSGSGNITFASNSVFIINGTDASGYSFDYTGSGNLSGNNVTFFITGQSGYTAGPIHISGSGNLTFSAASSGSYKGLLFYQDPGVTYAGANVYAGSGNVTGSFYFKTTSLNYQGSGNNVAQALIANTITFSGSGNISLKQDATGQLTGLVTTVANLLQ